MRIYPTLDGGCVGIARVPADMGSKDDPVAVTSPSGQVRGLRAATVVDASIFPMIPCANTNFPTMMVAEKIADDIVNAERRYVGVPE